MADETAELADLGGSVADEIERERSWSGWSADPWGQAPPEAAQ
jgi:hypothetical protein